MLAYLNFLWKPRINKSKKIELEVQVESAELISTLQNICSSKMAEMLLGGNVK